MDQPVDKQQGASSNSPVTSRGQRLDRRESSKSKMDDIRQWVLMLSMQELRTKMDTLFLVTDEPVDSLQDRYYRYLVRQQFGNHSARWDNRRDYVQGATRPIHSPVEETGGNIAVDPTPTTTTESVSTQLQTSVTGTIPRVGTVTTPCTTTTTTTTAASRGFISTLPSQLITGGTMYPRPSTAPVNTSNPLGTPVLQTGQTLGLWEDPLQLSTRTPWPLVPQSAGEVDGAMGGRTHNIRELQPPRERESNPPRTGEDLNTTSNAELARMFDTKLDRVYQAFETQMQALRELVMSTRLGDTRPVPGTTQIPIHPQQGQTEPLWRDSTHLPGPFEPQAPGPQQQPLAPSQPGGQRPQAGRRLTFRTGNNPGVNPPRHAGFPSSTRNISGTPWNFNPARPPINIASEGLDTTDGEELAAEQITGLTLAGRKAAEILKSWNVVYSSPERDNVEDFLENLDRCRGVSRLSEQDIMRALPVVLTGQAEKWYKLKGSLCPNLATFKQAFKKRFADGKARDRVKEEARRRKQGDTERIADYLEDMQIIFSYLDPPMPLNKQLDIVYRNIRSSYTQYFLRSHVSCYEDLDSWGEELEEKWAGENPRKTPLPLMVPKAAYRPKPPRYTYARDQVATVTGEVLEFTPEDKEYNNAKKAVRWEEDIKKKGKRPTKRNTMNSQELQKPEDFGGKESYARSAGSSPPPLMTSSLREGEKRNENFSELPPLVRPHRDTHACFNCFQLGHWQPECPYPRRVRKGGKPSTGTGNEQRG